MRTGARSDAGRRSLLPDAAKSLLEAYESSTGRAVHLDYLRAWALGELMARGFTGEDVWLVVRYVKKQIARGEERGRMTFTRASLEWERLMADPNVFESRLQTARERRLRYARPSRPSRDAPVTRVVDASGGTVTRLECPPERECVRASSALAAEFEALAKRLRAW